MHRAICCQVHAEVQGQALRQGDFLEGLLVGLSGQGSLCLVTLRLWTVFQSRCLPK